MPVSTLVQDIIHKLEVGTGARFLKWGLLVLAVLFLFGAYNVRGYRNMATQEAMDSAQLARNIAEGKGYTTLFIRPLSIYLVTNHYRGPLFSTDPAKPADPARLKDRHPDLANPPVYPLVLAALMKVLPFNYDIPAASPPADAKVKKRFWDKDGRFWWYPPDFLIALFNQVLLLGTVVLTYFLARFLFDSAVAWLSALLLLGTALIWRFSVSGLSTMLLLLIFLGLIWVLALLERVTREGGGRPPNPLILSGLAGLLVGIGGLTRYSFAWLIIPLLVFLVVLSTRERVVKCALAFACFALVFAPWVVRNYMVSGVPFGTATFAVMDGTSGFSENRLARSLAPDFSRYGADDVWRKLLGNSRQIVQTDLPKLAGSWVSAFFLVGLLLRFRRPAINRLRYFLLMCLPVLIVAQALGRTQLSEDSAEINSENLLVLLTPVVIIYGVSLFHVLVDQMDLPFRILRHLVIGVFAVVMCLPMILVFLPPRSYPTAYPPYHPPLIQQVSNWMNDKELMMSDIPWAVAWYGRRQCLWLTLNAQSDFYSINDYLKPIKALYLTPQTMDSRFLSNWIRPREYSWGSFVLESVLRKEIPQGFPLKKAPEGFLPEQLFLTDWERWRKP